MPCVAERLVPNKPGRLLGKSPVPDLNRAYWAVTCEAQGGGRAVVATEDDLGHPLTEETAVRGATTLNQAASQSARDFLRASEAGEFEG